MEQTGSINKKELREIVRRLGTEITESELDSADSNDDGLIDWEDFYAFMTTRMHDDE